MQLSVCRQHQTFLYIFFSTSVIPCYCRIFDWRRFTRPNGRMGMDRVSYTGNIYMCGPSQHWRVDMQKDRIYVLPRGLKNFLSYWAIMLLFLVLSGWQMHRCLAYVQIGILLFCSVKKQLIYWNTHLHFLKWIKSSKKQRTAEFCLDGGELLWGNCISLGIYIQ